MLLTDPSRFCRISWLTIPAAVAYGYAMNTTPITDTGDTTMTTTEFVAVLYRAEPSRIGRMLAIDTVLPGTYATQADAQAAADAALINHPTATDARAMRA